MATKKLKTRKIRKLDVKVDKQAMAERLWEVDARYKEVEAERKELRSQLAKVMTATEKVVIKDSDGGTHKLNKTSRSDKTIDPFWLADQMSKQKLIACVSVSNAKLRQQQGEQFLADAPGKVTKVASVRWS
jgi:hypothetical protein